MKKIILSLIFIVAIENVSWATNYCSGDAKGCWLFTEGSGTTVADSTGNGNTGNFLSSGHPAWYNTSLPSRSYITWAASFDATTDKINTGATSNQFPTNGTAWSMVAWVYDTNCSVTIPRRIIDKSSGGSGPAVQLDFTGGGQTVKLQVGGTTTLVRGTAASTFTCNQWNHIAVTWDGSTTAANAHIYINNVEPSYFVTTDGASLTDNSAQNFIIGSRNSDSTRVFSGYITEVGVFNRVLSSGEVSTIYTYGLTGTGSSSHQNIIRNATVKNATIN